jgi:hypothetical protein
MPIQIGPETNVASCAMGTTFFRVKNRPERGADHLLCSSTGLRIGWSYTSATPLYLHRHVLGVIFILNLLEFLWHSCVVDANSCLKNLICVRFIFCLEWGAFLSFTARLPVR